MQSAGESGFTVQYTRQVFKGPERIKDERYTVRYDAQNAIVEVGPPRPRPRPKPPAAETPQEPVEAPAGSSE